MAHTFAAGAKSTGIFIGANALSAASSIASDSDDDTSLPNVYDYATDTFWPAAGGVTVSGTVKRITINIAFASGQTLDAFGIAGHNLHSLDGSMALKYESAPGVYTDVATLATVDMAGDFTVTASNITSQTADNWRITIDYDSALGEPFFAVIAAGLAIRPERGVQLSHTPEFWAQDDELEIVSSDTGALSQSVTLRRPVPVSIEFANFTPAWVAANWPMLRDALNSAPMFFTWAGGAYPSHSVYFWKKNIVPPRGQSGAYRFGFSISGMGVV